MKYRVRFEFTQEGHAVVEAGSPEEARSLVEAFTLEEINDNTDSAHMMVNLPTVSGT